VIQRQGFQDEKILTIYSGRGGAGFVSFHREKYVDRGGPDGGDGGRGGNVYLKSSHRVKNLNHLRNNGVLKAQDGNPGRKNKSSGAAGEHKTILVPPGTIVTDYESGRPIHDFSEPQEKTILLLEGGKGGLGNMNFATSVNQAPQYAQPGGGPRNLVIHLNLKMIAEVGLVGLPNAGKSTLLAALTGAQPKIASYPFTTLTPNMGILTSDSYIQKTIADIPGIIAGANKGHGLGLSFLRHIERVQVLIFMIDINSTNIQHEFEMLRLEMDKYSPKLGLKPRLIVLNKIDELEDSEFVAELIQNVESHFPNEKIIAVSAKQDQNLDILKHDIFQLLKENERPLTDIEKQPRDDRFNF